MSDTLNLDPDKYDVAIIGAGPSGCACALALRDAGLHVVLIDRSEFPRDKVCGDAIPGPAFRLMDRIDPELGVRMRAFAPDERIHTSRGFAPNGQQVTMHWKTFSYNNQRLAFDNFLLGLVRETTTTTILTGRRLERIERAGKGLVCHFERGPVIRTPLVIGCDGANSVVARQLAGYDLKDPTRGNAVRSYYRGVQGVEAGTNEFHFLRELPLGYFWIFPVADGLVNVGLGMPTTKQSNNPRKLLERLVAEHPRLRTRFAGATAVDKVRGFALPFCTTRRPLSGDNYLLCGDAASLISPLWGHGIDTGMISGYHAARHAVAAHAAADFTAAGLHAYERVLDREIRRAFRRSRWVLRVVGRFPGLLEVSFRILRVLKVGGVDGGA